MRFCSLDWVVATERETKSRICLVVGTVGFGLEKTVIITMLWEHTCGHMAVRLPIRGGRQRPRCGGVIKDANLDLRSLRCLCCVPADRSDGQLDRNVRSSEKMPGLHLKRLTRDDRENRERDVVKKLGRESGSADPAGCGVGCP